MEESILYSILKLIGQNYDEGYFNFDVLTHINMALSALRQVGCGDGPAVRAKDAKTKWSDFLGSYMDLKDAVVEYVYLKTKLVYDPPASTVVIDSLKASADEALFRIQHGCELKVYGGNI